MKIDSLYRALKLIIVFLIGALLVGCEKDEPDTPTEVQEPNTEQPVVEEKPAVFDVTKPEASGITVEKYDMDEGTLEITVEAGKEPKVGDIIFSEITEKTPYGFLMKVASVKESSTKDYITRRVQLTALDISLYEFCQIVGITEPGWFPLTEISVFGSDGEGNIIEPEPGDGPKVVAKFFPLSFPDHINLSYKYEVSVPSIELYFDPSEIEVKTGLRAIIKTTEVLHADIKGKAKLKGNLFEKTTKQFIVQHKYKFKVAGIPVYVTTQFKPTFPYELSLSADLDMDIIRNIKYNRFEFCYNLLRDRFDPIDPSKGCYYQDFDLEKKEDVYEADERMLKAKLEGVISLGVDFEYSVGLYGGNLIDEKEEEGKDNDKTRLLRPTKYLSLGVNGGYKFEDKGSLGIQMPLDGNGRNPVRIIDENKISTFGYGKLWVATYKGDIVGQKIEFLSGEVEVDFLKWEFQHPFLFRDWKKMKVDITKPDGQILVTAKQSLPLLRCFKESEYGFCLESADGEDYQKFSIASSLVNEETGQLSCVLPVSANSLRRNVKYTIYPYSMITNFPFVEGTRMACREGVNFIITGDGQLSTSIIDDVPGDNL